MCFDQIRTLREEPVYINISSSQFLFNKAQSQDGGAVYF